MMMGGKGSAASAVRPLQNYYVAANASSTGAQLQITGINSADRASGLVWLIITGNETGTLGGLGPIAGETTRYTDTMSGCNIRIQTYVTDGTEFNYLNTQYSDHTWAALELYVLDPSLGGYSDSGTTSTAGTSISFNSLLLNTVDDLAIAFMGNNSADDTLSSAPAGWDQLTYEGQGGLQGYTNKWLYYLYYKFGGHSSTTVQPTTGDFAWGTSTTWESKLIGFDLP